MARRRSVETFVKSLKKQIEEQEAQLATMEAELRTKVAEGEAELTAKRTSIATLKHVVLEMQGVPEDSKAE